MAATATIHASAVLIGARALLIRGPSGSGKSRLAWALIAGAEPSRGEPWSGSSRSGSSWPGGTRHPFARLVADDRVHAEAMHGRLLLRCPPALAGLIEMRGLGLRRLPCESRAVAGLVVDLDATGADRLPQDAALHTAVAGIALPRLAIAKGVDPLPLVHAYLASQAFDPPA